MGEPLRYTKMVDGTERYIPGLLEMAVSDLGRATKILQKATETLDLITKTLVKKHKEGKLTIEE